MSRKPWLLIIDGLYDTEDLEPQKFMDGAYDKYGGFRPPKACVFKWTPLSAGGEQPGAQVRCQETAPGGLKPKP